MTGASLSRWTMSYFAAALTALVIAEVLMAAGYGFPAAAIGAPQTLILVHLVTIGWLSLLTCGALFQFVPVLIAKPLYSDTLPLPALFSLLAGLVALILGFLQLGGQVEGGLPLLAIAGGLLGLGFALVLWNLGCTLWRARPLPLPARFVAAGLAGLTATVLLGATFAVVLGGTTQWAPLVALTGSALPIHAIAGLGGWLTLVAMGVSYRLLAMFMLAPELDGRRPRAVLALGTTALAIAVLGGPMTILLDVASGPVLALAGLAGLIALGLYGTDVVHLYRDRKRRKIELNSYMAALALVSLIAVPLLFIALLVLGRLSDGVAAVVFLVAFGWLSGLGLGKLYKIVPFLTWLECYGPVLGKTPTPRVQDLVVEKHAAKWFLFYFLAVWVGTGALIVGANAAFQGAAAAMLVATAGIVNQLVRARRLADVTPALRAPQGVRQPRLLLSLSHRT